LGSFEAIECRGGSEDPWLCVSGFHPICLYHDTDSPATRNIVNSGMYLKLEAVRV
jgi:hypothetical protein